MVSRLPAGGTAKGDHIITGRRCRVRLESPPAVRSCRQAPCCAGHHWRGFPSRSRELRMGDLDHDGWRPLMTERATFGDLLDAAREQLGHAGSIPARPRDGIDRLDVTRGLHAPVGVIGRYLQDDIVRHDCDAANLAEPTSPWPTTRVKARLAAAKAARYLQHQPMARSSWEAWFTEPRQRLNAAAQALAAGYDLQATYVAADPDGVRVGRSVWATVVCSDSMS